MSPDPLLEPFQLGNLTLRNRIISTAHAPSYQEGGHPRDRYRLYHEEKAKGGVALTIVGGSTNIAPDSPSVFGQLYAGDDSILPWFQQLTSGVKAYGASVMCQITHMGRRTAWDDGHWLPVLGPSASRERAHRSLPKAMEIEDIDRVVTQFAEAAVRCKQGGFDGIEILSHSHLLGQFLSPLINHRDDDYGGSLKNRMRMMHRVITAVRQAVGPDFVVGMRVTGDELTQGGLSGDECVEIAQSIAATKGVDFLNILAGAPYDDLGLAGWVPPMGTPSAPHLTIAGRIRASVDLPILHSGSIADVATARHAVAGGYLDLVGMTRAHLADPYLVSKLKSGNEARIRPCVGLGYCVDRVNQGKDAVCGHNAATGREALISHSLTKADIPKRVVVVGGGPGGLEAARICAGRGHKVVLFEASNRLGGQVNLAAMGQTRRQIWGVADWLIQEVTLLGVDIRMGVYAESAEVLAEVPDVVIVATGGWAREGDFEGSDHALSSWQVLSGEVKVTGDVLLFDDVGDHQALVCADMIAGPDCQVVHVTPDRATALDLGPTNSSVVLRDLTKKGVEFQCHLDLKHVEVVGNKKRVTLRNTLTDTEVVQTVDHVVIEIGTYPMDELYFDLKPGSTNQGQVDHDAMIAGRNVFGPCEGNSGYLLARIGDAIAGRNIHAAIYDAARICKSI